MLVGLFPGNAYLWVLCLAGLLLYFYSRRKLYWASWQLPGPNPALPLLGNLFILGCRSFTDIVSVLDREVDKYTKKCGIARFWLGPWLNIVINDPFIAQQLNQTTQLKSEEYQYLGKPFIRKGLLITNDLSYYRRVKKTFLLGLSPENLKLMMPHFHTECLRVVDLLREYSDTEESVFTEKIFKLLSLACVVKGTMNFDVHTKSNEENEGFVDSFESMLKYFQLRLMVPPLRHNFIHYLFGTRQKELKHIDIVLRYIRSIAETYKKNKLQDKGVNDKEYNDKLFIDHLMGEEFHLSEEEILANIFVMIGGGKDSIATVCTMLLIFLAQNPLVQQKLYEELVEVLGDNINICPSVENLNRMEYLDRVVKECLRMFTPTPYISRKVSEDITILASDGKEYYIPEGASIAIFMRNIHYNPKFYENPTTFDPDRWLPENVAKRPPESFLPFNNGGRKCLGIRYSIILIKTVAATILRAFEIVTSKSCEKFEDIHVEMTMTAKVGENCQIVLRERKKNQ